MSQHEIESARETGAAQAGVRLRVPERRQMAMVVQCPDDLVPAQHTVRMVMALVETLDVSRFAEPIRAREGVAGRDATDPRLLVGLWLYACIRGIGSAQRRQGGATPARRRLPAQGRHRASPRAGSGTVRAPQTGQEFVPPGPRTGTEAGRQRGGAGVEAAHGECGGQRDLPAEGSDQ